MNGKIMGNQVIKPFIFLVLTSLFLYSGHFASSVQGSEVSKIIFIVR